MSTIEPSWGPPPPPPGSCSLRTTSSLLSLAASTCGQVGKQTQRGRQTGNPADR